MRVAGRKKSCVNFVPAGPSFDRSVTIEELLRTNACRSVRFRPWSPGPPKKPREPLAGVGVGDGDAPGVVADASTTRVTRMSEPTLDNGDSTLSCACDR